MSHYSEVVTLCKSASAEGYDIVAELRRTFGILLFLFGAYLLLNFTNGKLVCILTSYVVTLGDTDSTSLLSYSQRHYDI